MAFILGLGTPDSWSGKQVSKEDEGENLSFLWKLNASKVSSFLNSINDKDLKMAKKLGLSLYHNDIFTEKSNAKWTRAYIYDEKDNVYIFYVQENPHDKGDLDPSRNFNYELAGKFSLKKKKPDWQR